MPAAPGLMVRGVLYTALTRARELLVIVGDDAAIRSMAANDKRQKRYSGLKWRLCHVGDEVEAAARLAGADTCIRHLCVFQNCGHGASLLICL